jgi:hypothetical protein
LDVGDIDYVMCCQLWGDATGALRQHNNATRYHIYK